MDPNQQPPAPQAYNSPGNYGPMMSQPPVSGQNPASRPRKSRLPIIIGAITLVLLLLIIGLVLLLAGGKKPAKTPVTTVQTPAAQGPQPATAIGIEQTGNSISQDLSSLNDDKDLPATMLDDRPLGL